ncbi:MAG TPA: TIGR03435 family protein [Vicinamibacterales bacterium]|nr:TIGR03435 family protein [Vicinamibacterales bacterium]
MRRTFVIVGVCAAVCVSTGLAQATVQKMTPAPLEVASIKESLEDRGGSLGMRPGGLMVATDIRVLDMVYMAFQGHPSLEAEQIFGVPDWASKIRYNIEARFTVSDAASAAGQTNSGSYIRAILNNRFAFQAHLEKRELPAYSVSASAGGVKLKAVDVDCEQPDKQTACATAYGPGRMTSHAMPIDDLIDDIRYALRAPAVDRTGLRGRFDVDLQWNPDPLANPDDPRPTIFGAVQAMGLRLERGRDVVDVLVVDHVEQPSKD